MIPGKVFLKRIRRSAKRAHEYADVYRAIDGTLRLICKLRVFGRARTQGR